MNQPRSATRTRRAPDDLLSSPNSLAPGACIPTHRGTGATPFLLAAMAADVEVMRVLSGAGADPNLTADNRTTALMLGAGLGRYLAESLATAAGPLEAVVLAGTPTRFSPDPPGQCARPGAGWGLTA